MSQKNSRHCSLEYQQDSVKQVLENLNAKSEDVSEVGNSEIDLIGSSPKTKKKSSEIQHWESVLVKDNYNVKKIFWDGSKL